MYSRLPRCVNVRRLLMLAFAAVLPLQAAERDPAPFGPLTCDPVMARLFAPAHPQLGRYEVCTSNRSLPSLARPEWVVEPMAPLDAFGTAGLYERAALARLYGGSRPMVARGWIQPNGSVEAVTLISPYPDAALTHLRPGTLIIRLIIS